MRITNQNLKANEFREILLKFTYKELKKIKESQPKDFLINSKSLETYEKNFENYIVVENDNIIDNKDNSPVLFYKYDFLKNSSPILIKSKIRLTKHPEKKSTRKLTDTIEINIKKTNTKKIEIKNNIKYLRNLSNQLKKNKSNIKRKYSGKINKKKFNKTINITYTYREDNKDNENSIIKLHKISKLKKKKNSFKKARNKFIFDFLKKSDFLTKRDSQQIYLKYKNEKL